MTWKKNSQPKKTKHCFACCLFITLALDDYRQLTFYVNELTHFFP